MQKMEAIKQAEPGMLRLLFEMIMKIYFTVTWIVKVCNGATSVSQGR